MTDTQFGIAIIVPIIGNSLMFGLFWVVLDRRFDDLDRRLDALIARLDNLIARFDDMNGRWKAEIERS